MDDLIRWATSKPETLWRPASRDGGCPHSLEPGSFKRSPDLVGKRGFVPLGCAFQFLKPEPLNAKGYED